MDYFIKAVTDNLTDEVERLLNEDFDINYKLPDSNKTALHFAASSGLDAMVYKLIRLGADINARDFNLQTPLHEASAKGHKKVVEILVNEDAAINAQDSDLQTPLFHPLFHWLSQTSRTSQADHMDIIKLLVDKGADINAKDRYGNVPLHFAINNECSKEKVQLLLKLGGNISALNHDHKTPLLLALERRSPLASVLISSVTKIEDAKDRYGNTPLHSAIMNDCSEEHVQLLMKLGGDINALNYDHKTPLMIALEKRSPLTSVLISSITNLEDLDLSKLPTMSQAISKGYLEFAQVLHKLGKSVLFKDEDGNNILHLAMQQTNIEVPKWLLSLNGVKNLINAINHNQKSPLVLAIENKSPMASILMDNVVNIKKDLDLTKLPTISKAISGGHVGYLQLLHNLGKNVLIKDDDGNNILHLAVKQDNVEVPKWLLSLKGVKSLINDTNHQSLTPIHEAVKNSNLKAIKLLIKHGAKVNSKNESNVTPLHSAAMKTNIEIVEILIKNGAKINVQDKNGYTPMHCAAMKVQVEIIRLLWKHGGDTNVKDKSGRTPLQYNECSLDFGKVKL